MEHGQWNDQIIAMTNEDIKTAIGRTGSSKKEQEILKAILVQAIPSEFDFLCFLCLPNCVVLIFVEVFVYVEIPIMVGE